MDHDRIHARPPGVDPESWHTGSIRSLTERDGHCVLTVAPDPDEDTPEEHVELTVMLAIRDLFVSRLDAEDPVGQQVWFKQRGR